MPRLVVALMALSLCLSRRHARLERLREGRAEDVADFEPFYLKDFIPGTPKDPLGLRTPSA